MDAKRGMMRVVHERWRSTTSLQRGMIVLILGFVYSRVLAFMLRQMAQPEAWGRQEDTEVLTQE